MKFARVMFMFYAPIAVAVLPACAAAQQGQQDGPAQQGTTMGGGQMPMMGMMSQGGMMPMMGGMMMPMMPMIGMTDHIEGRLAFLKTELKITDAQLPPWNAFADALRASAMQMNDMMKERPATMQGGTPPSLPQRLDRHEKHMAAHLEMLRKTKAALLPLYASLSEEQRRSADALFHGPMGM
jgi:hypothetical protein